VFERVALTKFPDRVIKEDDAVAVRQIIDQITTQTTFEVRWACYFTRGIHEI